MNIACGFTWVKAIHKVEALRDSFLLAKNTSAVIEVDTLLSSMRSELDHYDAGVSSWLNSIHEVSPAPLPVLTEEEWADHFVSMDEMNERDINHGK